MQDLQKLIHELEAGAVELEEERAKADALFLSIGDGAIATDERGRIEHVNQMALDLLGYQSAELLGQWFPKTIVALNEDGNQLTEIDRPMTKAILDGKPVSGKYFYIKKDGSQLPVVVTVSPVIINDKPAGAIEVFRDYSKELEVDRLKSEFISLASHQLRTPLTGIQLYSHMLADGYAGQLSPKQSEFLNSVLVSTDRMGSLVNMLLNITRVEAGRVAINPVPCQMPTVLDQIVNELTPKAGEKQIKLLKQPAADLPQITTDPDMVKELFANLISNAIKYTPDGGTVTCAIKVEGREMICSVTDTGYGIPAKEQTKVFAKFFRAANILKKETVGTGLGLYLVKIVAESLGGRVWFKSIENQGTTFWFALPLAGIKAKAGTTELEHGKEMS